MENLKDKSNISKIGFQKPPVVKGGIKLSRSLTALSSNLFAQKWIQFIETHIPIDEQNIGKKYAQLGQIVKLEILLGEIRAIIQGVAINPETVTITTDVFPPEKWNEFAKLISSKAEWTAKLLANIFLPELDNVLETAQINLMPLNLPQTQMKCTCVNNQHTCEHIVALLYILADKFDSQPFLYFNWRGKTKEECISLIWNQNAQPAQEQDPLRKGIDFFWYGQDVKKIMDPINHDQSLLPKPIIQKLGLSPFQYGGQNFSEMLDDAYEYIGAITKARIQHSNEISRELPQTQEEQIPLPIPEIIELNSQIQQLLQKTKQLSQQNLINSPPSSSPNSLSNTPEPTRPLNLEKAGIMVESFQHGLQEFSDNLSVSSIWALFQVIWKNMFPSDCPPLYESSFPEYVWSAYFANVISRNSPELNNNFKKGEISERLKLINGNNSLDFLGIQPLELYHNISEKKARQFILHSWIQGYIKIGQKLARILQNWGIITSDLVIMADISKQKIPPKSSIEVRNQIITEEITALLLKLRYPYLDLINFYRSLVAEEMNNEAIEFLHLGCAWVFSINFSNQNLETNPEKKCPEALLDVISQWIMEGIQIILPLHIRMLTESQRINWYYALILKYPHQKIFDAISLECRQSPRTKDIALGFFAQIQKMVEQYPIKSYYHLLTQLCLIFIPEEIPKLINFTLNKCEGWSEYYLIHEDFMKLVDTQQLESVSNLQAIIFEKLNQIAVKASNNNLNPENNPLIQSQNTVQTSSKNSQVHEQSPSSANIDTIPMDQIQIIHEDRHTNQILSGITTDVDPTYDVTPIPPPFQLHMIPNMAQIVDKLYRPTWDHLIHYYDTKEARHQALILLYSVAKEFPSLFSLEYYYIVKKLLQQSATLSPDIQKQILTQIRTQIQKYLPPSALYQIFMEAEMYSHAMEQIASISLQDSLIEVNEKYENLQNLIALGEKIPKNITKIIILRLKEIINWWIEAPENVRNDKNFANIIKNLKDYWITHINPTGNREFAIWSRELSRRISNFQGLQKFLIENKILF